MTNFTSFLGSWLKISAALFLVLLTVSADVMASGDERVAPIDGSVLVFHRIEPGKFQMGEVQWPIEVEITRPFEMSATETTQVIWRRVAELAHDRFADRYLYVPKNPAFFPGDLRPVEYVYFDAVEGWISALNELSVLLDESELAPLIPSHKKGDQYRLPTDAEWEFVVRGRGRYQDVYPFGSTDADLAQYGWYRLNSGRQTSPVAQLKPITVDGKDFYDLLGNVGEYVSDWYGPLSGGKDLQGPSDGYEKVIRGGDWANPAEELRSGLRLPCNYSGTGNTSGFRLVRVVR